ncbi:MAG: hypothetical protein J2P54_15760, partial [Bradyrhizobiaceae bacterium]|nr:hypothetical protein [Bradyrhizobiaceae bacterium]
GATDAQRGAAPLDELHLDELHPDPAYAMATPASSPEEPGHAAITAKVRSFTGLLVGAVVSLLGFGLVCLGLIGALPRANSAIALIGTFLLVAGLLMIWFRGSEPLSE